MSGATLPNYFTCTLGEADRTVFDIGDLRNINDFVDYQAETYSKTSAVGFPTPFPGNHDWSYELFSFEDLRSGSIAVAREISSIISSNLGKSGPQCVGLLCPSSIEFLFAWLGIMRAGFTVLFIAPQCQPAAIAYLCKSCNVTLLFHSKSYADSAWKASDTETKLFAVELPWDGQQSLMDTLIRTSKPRRWFQPKSNSKASDTAFIFHTSGTSTGLPKPIFQSHKAALGVLPVLDGQQNATFTTTPLYHGGIADCLTAWTSNALIWLFPASDVPITSKNIRSSLSAAKRASLEQSVAEIKYFSCVPYLLQMLVEEPQGIRILQGMEIVGVGGAALNKSTGSQLVKDGIRLVSRFGSAECGFLLSSHREYDEDKEWEYFRLPPNNKSLVFEEQDGSSKLSELVVKAGWPHMTKVNRPNGNFATSDLFEPHPKVKGAWRHHSRSDSQITLSTGMKFDPEPLENLVASSSSLIREVLVFGSGRQDPGILVFLSSESMGMNAPALDEEIWKVIQAANSEGQNHTRIHRNLIVIMPLMQPILDRSSKGSLMRGSMEQKFAYEINQAYIDPTKRAAVIKQNRKVCISKQFIRAIINEALGQITDFDENADFYANGVDSAACTRIRSLLNQVFRVFPLYASIPQLTLVQNISESQKPLPWNIVYDCGTISRLSEFIRVFQSGALEVQSDEELEMIELAGKLSEFEVERQVKRDEQQAGDTQCVVLLTGSTGALGAHILDILRTSPRVSQIICLVRAVDHHTARSRVSASLLRRKKLALDIANTKVLCSPYRLSNPNLGISDMELSHIRASATHIIHAAWAVNFSIPLKSFVDEHLVGLHNILGLALSCSLPIQFTFCSSTASILGPFSSSCIEERISTAPSDAGATGYSKSKWVAEHICAAVAKKLNGSTNILRIGQLTGDTKHGVWNISEAWPLVLSTVDAIACLPELDENLSWLPLDTAATAIMEIATKAAKYEDQARVYHLVNTSSEATWSDLLTWSSEAILKPFDVVSPILWLDKLENFPKAHPAKGLLGFWRSAYGNSSLSHGGNDTPVFSIVEAQNKSTVMRCIPPVDKQLIAKIWCWLEEEITTAKE